MFLIQPRCLALSQEGRGQLMSISGATINRMLAPTRKGLEIKGISATKAGTLLRNSITVRRAGDEHESAPGFVEADLVAHFGPTLVGELVRTITVTDVFTGWTEHMAIRNSAHRWVIEDMTQIQARLPFPLVGLDTDNGGEFVNHALINWQRIEIFSSQGLGPINQMTTPMWSRKTAM